MTDIMMPEVDGLELCRTLKGDFRWSHIPVIVLSAHMSPSVKVAAMNAGADIYIEKPFSLDYLVSCIDSMAAKRNALIQMYIHQKIGYAGTESGLSEQDEKFVNSLNDLVMENLSDPDWSVEQMAAGLYLSKSTLTRKMRGLLGTTPNELLRVKRLIKAAELLCEGKYQVNEVCYSVGFSTPSYFIRCFKKYYGVLPTEYAGSLKKTNNA